MVVSKKPRTKPTEKEIIDKLNNKIDEHIRAKSLYIDSKKRKLNNLDDYKDTEKNTNSNQYINDMRMNYDAYLEVMTYYKRAEVRIHDAITSNLEKRGFEISDTPNSTYVIGRVVKNNSGNYSLSNEFDKLKEDICYRFYLSVDDDDDNYGHYVVEFFMTFPEKSNSPKKFNIKAFIIEKNGSGNGERAMTNLFNICEEHNAIIYVYESINSARYFWKKIKDKKLIKDFSFIEEHVFEIGTYRLNLNLDDFSNYVYNDIPIELENLNAINLQQVPLPNIEDKEDEDEKDEDEKDKDENIRSDDDDDTTDNENVVDNENAGSDNDKDTINKENDDNDDDSDDDFRMIRMNNEN